MSEPEKIQVTRYRCIHCRKSWASKRSADDHAARCWFDPANRACKTCEHHQRDRRVHGGDGDVCRVGLPMPLIRTIWGHDRRVCQTDCEAHRLRGDYAHPDVLDALDDAARTH